MWSTHTKPHDCTRPYLYCAGLVHVINKFRVKTLGLVPVRLGNKGPHLLAAHQVCINPRNLPHTAFHIAAPTMCHPRYAYGDTSLMHPCCRLRQVQFSVNAGCCEVHVRVSWSCSLRISSPLANPPAYPHRALRHSLLASP